MSPRRLLAGAGALALLSLGLPWGTVERVGAVDVQVPLVVPLYLGENVGTVYNLEIITSEVPVPETGVVHGLEHPARVIGAITAVGLWLAVRRGSRRLASAALLVGITALPLGLAGDGTWAGPVVYAGALAVAGAALVQWRGWRARPGLREPGTG